MKAAFGMKCPNGHMMVQVMVGGINCCVCGAALVPNHGAAPVGVNRTCTQCHSAFGMLSSDTGKCPQCGKPW